MVLVSLILFTRSAVAWAPASMGARATTRAKTRLRAVTMESPGNGQPREDTGSPTGRPCDQGATPSQRSRILMMLLSSLRRLAGEIGWGTVIVLVAGAAP